MSEPKKKKHVVRNVLIAVFAVIVLAAIFAPKDNKSSSSSSSSTSTSSTAEAAASTASATEDTTAKVTEARQKYQQIVLGDMMNQGTGGTVFEDVKAILGEPSSTSESSIGNSKTVLATWSESNITGSAVFTVTFTNNAATSKGYSGFSVLNNNSKITLDDFNAIPTDGTLTYDAALVQFGQPDGETESLFNGQTSNIVSWYNANGSFGANFNITFDNGVATGKSQYGMK